MRFGFNMFKKNKIFDVFIEQRQTQQMTYYVIHLSLSKILYFYIVCRSGAAVEAEGHFRDLG